MKIISICNKVIYDVEKSSSFINIWLQILQIKFLEIKKFANLSKWRIVSSLIKSLEHKGNWKPSGQASGYVKEEKTFKLLSIQLIVMQE